MSDDEKHCNILRVPDVLYSDALDEMAAIDEANGKPVQARWQRMKASEVRRKHRDQILPGATMFLCGSLKVSMCLGATDCGRASDFLCDYPVGGGKTCDLALCPDHAQEVSDDRHLCPFHLAEHTGRVMR